MSVPIEAKELFDEFTNNELYGKIEFIFKSGQLVFVKREETIIPHDAKYVREEVPNMRSRQAHR